VTGSYRVQTAHCHNARCSTMVRSVREMCKTVGSIIKGVHFRCMDLCVLCSPLIRHVYASYSNSCNRIPASWVSWVYYIQIFFFYILLYSFYVSVPDLPRTFLSISVISDRNPVVGIVAFLPKSASIERRGEQVNREGWFLKSKYDLIFNFFFYKRLFWFLIFVLFSIQLFSTNSHDLFEATPSVLPHTLQDNGPLLICFP
jgi:hypothetical protein